MNLGYRIFIVGDDNSIIQISKRSFNDFYLKHKPALQRFSGSVINVATVLYTLDERKPNQIIRIDYMRVKVDSDGADDAAGWRGWRVLRRDQQRNRRHRQPDQRRGRGRRFLVRGRTQLAPHCGITERQFERRDMQRPESGGN